MMMTKLLLIFINNIIGQIVWVDLARVGLLIGRVVRVLAGIGIRRVIEVGGRGAAATGRDRTVIGEIDCRRQSAHPFGWLH